LDTTVNFNIPWDKLTFENERKKKENKSQATSNQTIMQLYNQNHNPHNKQTK